MSFIVQTSSFVHLLTLKIVSPDPSPQVVPIFHCIPSYAPDLHMNPIFLSL